MSLDQSMGADVIVLFEIIQSELKTVGVDKIFDDNALVLT